jgi:hypothetical protein
MPAPPAGLHQAISGAIGCRLDERFDGLVAEPGGLRQVPVFVEALGQLAQARVDGVDPLDVAARMLQMRVEAADLCLDLLEIVTLQAPRHILEGDGQTLLQLLDARAERACRFVGVDARNRALQPVGDVDQAALQPGTADIAALVGRWSPAAIMRRSPGRAGLAPLRLAFLVGLGQRLGRLAVPWTFARLRGGSPPFGFGRRHVPVLGPEVCAQRAHVRRSPDLGAIEATRDRLRSGRLRRAQILLEDAAPARKLVAQTRNPS